MAKDYERAVERYLKQQVEAVGGICRKFVSPGHRGVPDRICVFPPFAPMTAGTVWWIETKALGEKLRPEQKRELDRLKKLGQLTAVIYTKEMVDKLIAKYKEVRDDLRREAELAKSDAERDEESAADSRGTV